MLSGIKIIEFEGIGPAPFAGMFFADLGAEVIVLHRKFGGQTPGKPKVNLLDRGKKSISVDLKSVEDLEIVRALIKKADGIIEGFRPGVMEKLGLGPAELLSLNSKLIYGRITGWGQYGPRSQDAGHDLNYIGHTGALWYASNAGETPFPPPTVVGDIGGGALYLIVGMLAALLKLKKSGKGCIIDAAIVDGSSHMMSLLLSLRSSGDLKSVRGESLLDGPHWSRCYVCKDGGYISVQCLEPKFYSCFLGLLNLGDDPIFQRQFDRSLWPKLVAILSGKFVQKERNDWMKIFSGSDACVAPVLSPDEVLLDPHLQARGIWRESQGHLQAAPAPRFSTWSPKANPEIPEKDRDRESILKRLRTLK